MLAAALITFREGLEAALIVGIVLGYLKKTGHIDQQRSVWWGVVVAIAASLAAALGLQAIGARFEGRAEQVFEGVTMLLAAGVLTWMVFWMQAQGRRIKGQLEEEVRQAVATEQSWALFGLAFLAVVREGIETVLFLSAAVFTSSPVQTVTGGLVGLAVAVVVGWLLFAASARLDVRRFFQVTGVLLIVFAAGLVAYGVHEFQEAGLLPILVEHVWDINPILNEKGTLGSILKSLFGYNGNPSLIEVLSYVGYYAVIGLATWRQKPAAEAVEIGQSL
ncbi:MAG TPA: high-affinity iron transporter [Anaerolineae bacterium]|nr:high-affinity iron transporter [Anaerolineae bacterium]